jgi:hypothetical protein
MRRLKEIDPKQIYLAAEEVQKLFSGAGEGASNPSPKQEASPPSKDATFDPLKYLASLDAEHPALASLGLSPDTLRSAKVGYASKGPLAGRLAVAWHDADGNIAMFIGVSLNGGEPTYRVSKNNELPYWFGRFTGEVRVVGSIIDVLHAAENGVREAVCYLMAVKPNTPKASSATRMMHPTTRLIRSHS